VGRKEEKKMVAELYYTTAKVFFCPTMDTLDP